MIDALATPLVVASLLLAAWAVALALLGRGSSVPQLVALGAVEAALVVQAVVAGVRLAGGTGLDDGVTFLGYLLASLVVLPLGTLWALTERSRWGPTVLAVACLTVAVVVVRLQQLWEPAIG